MAFNLVAKKREGNNAEAVRGEGLIPGILYGQGIEPVSVAVAYNIFSKLYNQAGESSLIDCQIEGGKEPVKVIIQDVQFDPVKGRFIHFDLRQINMLQEMNVSVQLNFINEAPAVKELGGTLIKAHDSLEIKCLPKDLVSSINVDLNVLKTFNDVIHVKDLQLPAGITTVENVEQVIAKVLAPLSEEQLKAMEDEGKKGVEAVEVTEKVKEAEGEEGEASAKGGPASGGEENPSANAQGKEKK